MRLRTIASEEQYRQHLAPIETGAITAGWDTDPEVTLVASTKDLRNNRGSVYMDHGVGLQWHGARTLDNIRENAPYVLAPNEFLASMYRAEGIEAEVIGTPKMDALARIPHRADGPVAVSFHWLSPQRSHILRDYRDALLDLAERTPLIGHAHPRIARTLRTWWEGLGVEFVPDFAEVVARASVYCADHSSTLYEWAALGRPVVLLDQPAQRSFISVSTGLRYEHYAAIGPHATPRTLVELVAGDHDGFREARAAMTEALYPYLGASVARTLEVLWTRNGRP